MLKDQTVDTYIASAPIDVQPLLKEIRKIIKESVPEAQEKMSYGMPYYGYKGKLVYFAFAKNHIGLYIPPPVIQDFEKELVDYQTAIATVRFPLDKKLPRALVKKLIKARVSI